MSLAWVSYSFFSPITLGISLLPVSEDFYNHQIHSGNPHTRQLYQQLAHAVVDAKKIVSSSCSGIDQVASYAVSMPHYLSVGANEATSKAVTDVLSSAASGLDLVIDSLEGECLRLPKMWWLRKSTGLAEFVLNAYIGQIGRAHV